MTRSIPVLRAVATAAATVVLALSAGLWGAAPGRADETTEPATTSCGLNCETGLIVLADQKSPPDNPGKSEPKAPETPPEPAPAPPAPAPPPAPAAPIPAAPAPAPVPTLAQEPSAAPVEESPSAEPSTTSASPTPSSASPSAESNWNQPITKSPKPTQAAAVSRNDGPGLFGSPGLLAIMAGVLLVGIAGLAFAWWGRNRFASH